MNDAAETTVAPPAEEWGLVEIFGHRQHYGRFSEVERFGAKMLRVDEPTEDPDTFKTFFYGGAAIFSQTLMTEEACRAYCDRYRPRPVKPRAELPAPEFVWDEPNTDDDGDDAAFAAAEKRAGG